MKKLEKMSKSGENKKNQFKEKLKICFKSFHFCNNDNNKQKLNKQAQKHQKLSQQIPKRPVLIRISNF